MGLYVRHQASYSHDTGAHPENARRIAAIEERMSEHDWLGLELAEAPRAQLEQLTRVHPAAHIETIERLSGEGGGMIDMDTIVSPGSYQAALRGAGGAIHAVDRLLDAGAADGRPGFAFCGLRPPGHHCEAARAMGFCLLNNVAVAAAHALSAHGAERILICDWDVHHGNGTEEIFLGSDQVLFTSIHQSPLYPGTGPASEVGTGIGEGFTVNLPVQPGAGGGEFRSMVADVVVPLIDSWKPGLVCISAGFDAHADDPLGQCELTAADFAGMAALIQDAATRAGAPVLVCLEGGYDTDALAASVLSTLRALSGERIGGGAAAVHEVASPHRERLARYWDCFA